MRHSTWVKMCFAVRRLRQSMAVNPMAATAAPADASSSVPSALGNSQSPASRPVFGRFRKAIFPSFSRRNTVFSSTRRSFFAFFTGRASAVPSRCPRHSACTGHSPHRGAVLGPQTVAPSSIMAWLKMRISAVFSGITAASPARTAPFVLGSRMSPWQSVSRAATRRTLPSTAGSRRPKAAAAMAEAV